MRYPAASNESLEGQKECMCGQVTSEFLVNCSYCCAYEQRDITFPQKGFPFDGEGSCKIYTGDLKGPGSSDSYGRQRSLALLPERVLRNLTREARAQDLLSLQYPEFPPQFREHNANSQVL
jgi:hypothetical protein